MTNVATRSIWLDFTDLGDSLEVQVQSHFFRFFIDPFWSDQFLIPNFVILRGLNGYRSGTYLALNEITFCYFGYKNEIGRVRADACVCGQQ